MTPRCRADRANRILMDQGNEATTLTIQDAALGEVRRFDGAIAAHQDAAAMFRETGDSYAESVALRNLERDQPNNEGEHA